MEAIQATIRRLSVASTTSSVNLAPMAAPQYGRGANVYVDQKKRQQQKANLDRQRKIAICAGVALVVVMIVAAISQSNKAQSHQQLTSFVSAPPLEEVLKSRVPPDVSSLEGCTINTITDPPSDEVLFKLKPFWVPSYPNTDHGLLSRIINNLTGMSHASKSYYAKGKSLRKCFGRSPTVACEQIHPVTKIGPPPEQQTHKFQSRLILPIRNPATVVPAHHQDKAVRYHQQQGQVPVNMWRDFRDAYLEKSLFRGWRGVIDTWTNMTGYSVGMYVPYELLVDLEAGPVLVRQLAALLRNAGFPTVDDASADCVWFQAVAPVLTAPGHPHYYFAVDYLPGYTVQEKQYLVRELRQMQQDHSSDAVLVAILDDYVEEVMKETVTDTVWSEKYPNPHRFRS